jgi:hypothetical protein
MRNKEGEHSLIGFIALCQSRSFLILQTKRGILRHPASVLAPGSALESLPSVALSSVQGGPIIVEQDGVCRKITHPIRRADFRSWPINDPDENFVSADRRLANYTTKNVLASPAGKGVKTSVPRVVVNGRFWDGHEWPVLRWPPRIRHVEIHEDQ